MQEARKRRTLWPIADTKWLYIVFIVFAILLGTFVGKLTGRYVLLLAVLMVGLPFASLVVSRSSRHTAVVLLLAFVPMVSILKAVTGSRFAPLTFDVGIFLACAFQLAEGLIRGDIRVGWLDLFLGVFLTLAFLQMFNPNVPSLLAGIEGFRKFAFMSIAFYVGRHVIRAHDWSLFQGWMIVLPALISIYGIKQFFFMSALDYRMIELATSAAGTYLMGGHVRPFSTLPGPFHLGLYLMVAILLIVSQMRDRHISSLSRLFTAIVLGLQLTALILTRTKSSWIGTMAGIVVLSLLQTRHWSKTLLKLISLALVGGTILTLILVISSKSTSQSRVLQDALFAVSHPLEAPTFQYRLRIWQEIMLPAMFEKPLIGYGTSSAGEGLNDLYYAGTSFSHFVSHNLYIKIFLELGLPGLLLFLLIVSSSMRKGWRFLRGVDCSQRGNVAILKWGMAVVISFLVAGLAVPTLDAYPVNYYFWLLLGLLSRGMVRKDVR